MQPVEQPDLVWHAAQIQFDIQAIQASWQAFDAMAHLRPIHHEAAYDRMVTLMNSLLDAAGDDQDPGVCAGLIMPMGAAFRRSRNLRITIFLIAAFARLIRPRKKHSP